MQEKLSEVDHDYTLYGWNILYFNNIVYLPLYKKKAKIFM